MRKISVQTSFHANDNTTKKWHAIDIRAPGYWTFEKLLSKMNMQNSLAYDQ